MERIIEKSEKELSNRITIEKAKNGYLVFVNDYLGHNGASVRVLPYVFETMQNLLTFIDEELNYTGL